MRWRSAAGRNTAARAAAQKLGVNPAAFKKLGGTPRLQARPGTRPGTSEGTSAPLPKYQAGYEAGCKRGYKRPSRSSGVRGRVRGRVQGWVRGRVRGRGRVRDQVTCRANNFAARTRGSPMAMPTRRSAPNKKQATPVLFLDPISPLKRRRQLAPRIVVGCIVNSLDK